MEIPDHIFLASETSMLGTSMPVLMSFAASHGLSLLQVGMIWTLAFRGKIFIYQLTILVVGYSNRYYFSGRDMLRVGARSTILEAMIVLLLVPFYWPLIGIR